MKIFREYDEHVTIKLFPKFKTVEEYYIQSSSVHDIPKLKIPSLFMNAMDDPLSPIDAIEIQRIFQDNPNTVLVLTRWGGHVCWFKGLRHKRVS